MTIPTVDVSVGVATLDRPDGLARCLDALLAGEARPAEVVVVDQGTGDGAREVVEARRRSARVVYVRQERRGLSASRNAAIASAGCPVVAVTDDDCVPHHRWLAAIGRVFDAGPRVDAVSGRVLPLGPEVPGHYAVSSRRSTVRADFRRPVSPWRVGTGANFAVRRAALAAIGGYDERLGAGSPGKAGEDLDVLHRLLRAGACIRYEPDAVVYHERQPEIRRVATRWSYGHGVGALCGLRWREGDAGALRILGAWVALRGRLAVRSALGLRPSGLRDEWLVLAGTARGLRYGFRVAETGASAGSPS